MEAGKGGTVSSVKAIQKPAGPQDQMLLELSKKLSNRKQASDPNSKLRISELNLDPPRDGKESRPEITWVSQSALRPSSASSPDRTTP
eukprot:2413987-Pyramimonas_sp.AAC.2